MANFEPRRPLPEVLEWIRPPINWDPVPPWVFEQLDPDILKELVLVDLGFQREVMERQLGVLDQKVDLIKRGMGK